MLVFPFLLSLAIAVITTPVIAKLAVKFGFVDNPQFHKHPAIIHSKIIPRAGGLAIYLAVIPTILIFVPLTKAIIGLIIAATLTVIVGTIDDKYDLSPMLRLISNFIAV